MECLNVFDTRANVSETRGLEHFGVRPTLLVERSEHDYGTQLEF